MLAKRKDLFNAETVIKLDTTKGHDRRGREMLIFIVTVNNDYDSVTYKFSFYDIAVEVYKELIEMFTYKDDVTTLNAEIYSKFALGYSFSYEMK